jgi:hypothetical protein
MANVPPKGFSVKSDEEFIQAVKDFTVENSMGCWLWTGRDYLGYGKLRFGPPVRRDTSVHRESYRVFIGEIPEGFLVRHRCHNKRCCNPLHLDVGTDRDNWLDMLVDGHTRLIEQDGEANISSKLSEQDVYDIRTIFKTGEISSSALAAKYDVARRCIERTIVGVAYSCYTDVPPYDWRDLPVEIFRGKLTKQGKQKILDMSKSGMRICDITKNTHFTKKMVDRVLYLGHARI